MWFDNLWRARSKQTPAQSNRVRLTLECLENREVPAGYTAATVPELIGAINTANLSAEADTITLAAGKTFALTAMNDTEYRTGLPVIRAEGGPLTIIGNGDVIERSTQRRIPRFRLFQVVHGGALTLENMTLQGGWSNAGGAILNSGALTMIGVTVQKNTAEGHLAQGGGVYSDGSLTLQNSRIQGNLALGSDGHDGGWIKDPDDGRYYSPPGPGGSAFGGGLHVAGGSASLLGTSVVNNTAKGGQGGSGKANTAPDGFSRGGGIYIGPSAAVTLNVFTVANTTSNVADADANIAGDFTLVP
jgi:predicted outer membrane repeat protein